MDDLLTRLSKSFADGYRVDEELRGGGMSRLFLATDLALNRKVVIKILPPELTSDMMVARFKRESEVTAHLQHPNILPVITAGVRDDLMFYVMPFISGESLRERLRREGQLPVADSVSILCEVASALSYAHRKGVIHRDIKPENILLQDGHAILADFGIAAALTPPGEAPHSRITRTGMSMGTVGYMAPEQSLGASDVDHRADIYSLGVVGHEMLAGTPPFTGTTTQAILAANLTQQPPRLDHLRDDVPIPVCRAVERALKKDPTDRFQQASELITALGQQAPRLSRISRAISVRRLRRISKTKIAAGVALLLVATAGGLYAYYRAPASPRETVSVVVAPFDVSTDIGLWHEGIVDLLARNIDGAGPLRTVSPTLAIRRWNPGTRSDREGAVRLAKQTGAQYAIYGSLITSIGDSVRMHFGLVDVATDSLLLQSDALDLGVEKLADALTVQVLRTLGARHRIGATRATSIGSDSALAVKAFLQGEQYYRRTLWDSASIYYDRAVSIDTTFAIALRRAGLVITWKKNENDSAARAYAIRAGMHIRSLAPRDSLLITADSVTSALEKTDPSVPDWHLLRRLFATVNEAARRYPDDPEVWYVVGEARYHHGYGGLFDITEPQVRDAFNKSIALDSAFAPAYIHNVELGFSLDGAAAGRAAAREYLARDPAGQHADAMRLIEAVTDPSRARSADTEQMLERASSDALFAAWITIRRWSDSSETALRLLRAIERHPRTSPGYAQDSSMVQTYLPLQLAYRGRFREAYFVVGDRPSRLFAPLALLGAIDSATATRVFSGWLASAAPQAHTALAWWSAHRDTAAILSLSRSYAAALGRATPAGKAQAGYNSAAAQAYLLLARRDTVGALRVFSTLSDTLCLRCDLDRLTEARLLVATGNSASADRVLRQRLFSALTPVEILMVAERARAAVASGKEDIASRYGQAVMAAWSRGDPEARAVARTATRVTGG